MSTSRTSRNILARHSFLSIGALAGFIYGLIIYIEFHYITHHAHALAAAISISISVGAITALCLWLIHKKWGSLFQARYNGQSQKKLAKIVRQGQLPSDAAVRKALPAYLTNMLKLNRYVRIMVPIEVGIVAIFFLGRWIADRRVLWLLATLSFVCLGIAAYVAGQRQRRQLNAMRLKLHQFK